MASASASQLAHIARPYAEAVFALARANKCLGDWSALLARIAAAAQEAQVLRLVHDPRVPKSALLDLFTALAPKSPAQSSAKGSSAATPTVSSQVHNFLRLLITNRRLTALPDIAVRYEQLRADAEGTVEAVLTTAFKLSTPQQQVITDALATKLGRKINMSIVIDEALIGGVVVRAGDIVIDASVRGQLGQLKSALHA